MDLLSVRILATALHPLSRWFEKAGLLVYAKHDHRVGLLVGRDQYRPDGSMLKLRG
jgi:hypothetical protein